jgi:hypothetical protein
MTYASEVATDSPVLYWRLGESSGTTATDSSGNGRDGTYAGSPTLAVAGLLAGDADTAVSFDRTDDYVSYASTVLSNSSAGTYEIWFKTSISGAGNLMYLFNASGTSNDFRVYVDPSDGQVDVIVNPTGTSSASFTCTGVWNDDVKHHLVVTYDDATNAVLAYIDGNQVGSGSVSGSSKLLDHNSLFVGSISGASGMFGGVLDEFAVYATALSSTRISAHYDAGASASIVVNGGTATETDTAIGGQTNIVVLGGIATETDTALAGSDDQVFTGGIAIETDTVFDGGVFQVIPGTPVVESDSAIGGSALHDVTYAGGTAVETDTVLAGTGADSEIFELNGTGTLYIDSEILFTTSEFRIQVLNKEIERAPASVTVTVSGARPEEPVTFEIDGTQVLITEADTDGNLIAVSLNIDSELGGDTVGVHTVTAIQPDALNNAVSDADTYTIERLPAMNPLNQGIDASPVEVLGVVSHSSNTRHWVFQDLLGVDVGGIGSWVMPINPSEMSSPHFEHAMSSRHTTAKNGRFHIFAAAKAMKEWSFSGYAPDRDFLDKLLQYRNLNRRFYIIDHHNRAWKVVLTNVDHRPRLRHTWMEAGQPSIQDDWGADYTVTAMILDQNYFTPDPIGEPGGGDPEGMSFEEGVAGGSILFVDHPWLFRYKSDTGAVAQTTYSSTSHGGNLSARLYGSAESSNEDTAWSDVELACKFDPVGPATFWLRIHEISEFTAGSTAQVAVQVYARNDSQQTGNTSINFTNVGDQLIYQNGLSTELTLEWDVWYQIHIDQAVGSVTVSLRDVDGTTLVTEDPLDTTVDFLSNPLSPAATSGIFQLFGAVNATNTPLRVVDFRVDDVVVPGTMTPAWDEETP